jgi:hypothetical protein
MRTRVITERLRRVARLGTLGAMLAFLAVPFIGAPSASAYPGFTVSATCSATSSQSRSDAEWGWYQGGISGTLLASGTVTCPDISGNGTSSVTGGGTQPASADTLLFSVNAIIGGCGNTNVKVISFKAGSSASVKLSATGRSPCRYAPGQGEDTVTVDGSLNS